MNAIVLAPLAGVELLLPTVELWLGRDTPIVHDAADLRALVDERRAIAPENQVPVWVFHQTNLLAWADRLLDLAEDIEVNLLLHETRDASLNTKQAVDVLQLSGLTHQLWTLNEDSSDHAVKSLPKLLDGQSMSGEGPATLRVTGDRRIHLAKADAVSEDDHPSQAFSLSPLLAAARRNEALPDLGEAPTDEAALTRFVWHLAGLPSSKQPTKPDDLAVLFFVPNGIGLGHVSRTLAVARAMEQRLGLDPQSIAFWSYSQAIGFVQSAGYRIIPRQTAKQLGLKPDRWSVREAQELEAFLRLRRPQQIIVDHSNLDPHLMRALDAVSFPCRKIWLRRAFWREGQQPPTFAQVSRFDAVITPGDLAGQDDPGPLSAFSAQPFDHHSDDFGTPHYHAGPVVLGRDVSVAKRFRFKPGRKCLVSLGGAGLREHPEIVSSLEKAARAVSVRLSWLLPPLAGTALRHRLSAEVSEVLAGLFPLAPHLGDFDGLILGAGYNAVHEAMLVSDRPCLLIPTVDGQRDDQLARARSVENKGWAKVLTLKQPQAWPGLMEPFFRQVKAGEKATRPPASDVPSGEDQIARYLEGLTP